MALTKPSFLAQPAVKSVRVYRNGDPYFAGRKFVINERQISTFEAFLREVTNGLEPPFGAVRNIYTPRQGHRIDQLEELDSGKPYVAGGKEKFKKLDYIQIGIKKTTPLPKDAQIKPVAHSRIIASARFRKPTQGPCIICVIPNGDLLNPAVRLLIPKRVLDQWEQVLASITEKVNLRTGAVRKSKAASLPPIPGSKKNKENGDRQIHSTETESEEYLLARWQAPKRKGKKEQASPRGESIFHAKPIKMTPGRNNTGSPNLVPENENSRFKVFEERRETMGAMEVQEDNQTQVELPIDQRPAEIVEEEEDLHEQCKEEGDGTLHNVEEEVYDDAYYKEATLKPCQIEESHRLQMDPQEVEKNGHASEANTRVVEQEVEEATQPEENPKYKYKYFQPHDRPAQETTEDEPQISEEIDDLAEQEKKQGADQMEEGFTDKYFPPLQDLPHDEEKIIDESEAEPQVEEEVVNLADQGEDIPNRSAGDPQGKCRPLQNISHGGRANRESASEVQAEEEIAEPAEQGVDQTEGISKDKYLPQQGLPNEEEITVNEKGPEPQAEEETAEQAEENHCPQGRLQKGDLDQKLKDGSAEQKAPLEENESAITPALDPSKDDNNLKEMLTTPAESIPDTLETDGKEMIESATGHAVLAQ
ncbi:doublecortin domain-containing protein 2-like isoform X2 [Narcine bancroftii]|uniref:doublecortin domain-containing protein 2-like isoform X2 n=1 Tax=Narcine bancroftii TaxID=1343680 RepID=UPI003831D851